MIRVRTDMMTPAKKPLKAVVKFMKRPGIVRKMALWQKQVFATAQLKIKPEHARACRMVCTVNLIDLKEDLSIFKELNVSEPLGRVKLSEVVYCLSCSKICYSLYQVRTHRGGPKGASCTFVCKLSKNCIFQAHRPAMLKHLISHGNEEDTSPTVCPICMQNFQTKTRMTVHFIEFHCTYPNQNAEYRCPQCYQTFSALLPLKKHLCQVHSMPIDFHVNDTLTCHICFDVFQSSAIYEKHLLLHALIKNSLKVSKPTPPKKAEEFEVYESTSNKYDVVTTLVKPRSMPQLQAKPRPMPKLQAKPQATPPAPPAPPPTIGIAIPIPAPTKEKTDLMVVKTGPRSFSVCNKPIELPGVLKKKEPPFKIQRKVKEPPIKKQPKVKLSKRVTAREILPHPPPILPKSEAPSTSKTKPNNPPNAPSIATLTPAPALPNSAPVSTTVPAPTLPTTNASPAGWVILVGPPPNMLPSTATSSLLSNVVTNNNPLLPTVLPTNQSILPNLMTSNQTLLPNQTVMSNVTPTSYYMHLPNQSNTLL